MTKPTDQLASKLLNTKIEAGKILMAALKGLILAILTSPVIVLFVMILNKLLY